jgi:hypothetical protein
VPVLIDFFVGAVFLKIRRFVSSGRTGSIPVPGTSEKTFVNQKFKPQGHVGDLAVFSWLPTNFQPGYLKWDSGS